MQSDLLRRIEAAIVQLRSRAADLYLEDRWTDGDFLYQISFLLEEIISPIHHEHTQDV